jgi:tetratricopeptide (TPR) repeat protein
VNAGRREFLFQFCCGAAAGLIPARLWGVDFGFSTDPLVLNNPPEGFYLRPRYRSERPLDRMLAKVEPGNDQFVTEKYAQQLADILDEWSASLIRSVRDAHPIARRLAPGFVAASPLPTESKILRSSLGLRVERKQFSSQPTLTQEVFLNAWQSALDGFAQILRAEFQITRIEAHSSSPGTPPGLETVVRYELVGTGDGFYREQRGGAWELIWEPSTGGDFRISQWRVLEETQARSESLIYTDIAGAALVGNSSFAAQLQHGTDYWRTVLDGACGIDIYGHNGVSVADIDNDGFDDLYVCQPAGLPNRLFRNRGNGTCEDITESSGLGILDNTACALFADFDNDGNQDVILVRANGPLLFVNDGRGRFRQKADAFHFENPPQGTFTGAAVADYDRDGWLDVYFCLYSYYQGTGQYRYPSPYHDAENGPPNFLMRNKRDGTFEDATARSGLNQNNNRYSFCCAWNDFNHDGWPDLYVVNDFGKKNLYRNNGDGTFTDVAGQTGAEDIGAGMSVSWLDYANDGAEDLYVGNMWTAAGLRVSGQDIFKKQSPPAVRACYQKHAMGNSLLRSRGQSFEDTTKTAGVGVGRWAWSSDAFDFDHDGFVDLYIANGMVSGPSRADLNSFFWRQVVGNSPDQAGSSHDYEEGWNAINELIRADQTWSGYERNVFYANNRDGTFSDISSAVGLDFIEDGRSFALADFDKDGRLEIFLKNRNAPQLRVLKNILDALPPSIAFRLQGTKSNRDAIGAVVTVESNSGPQTRTLESGSGFLSQHSKDIFFGLGETKGTVRASIRWPSGLVQSLEDLPADHRIWVTEGATPSRIEPFRQAATHSRAEPVTAPEALPTKVETWLLSPVAAPDFSIRDLSGRTQTLSAKRSKPLFLYFWTTKSPECQAHLQMFEQAYSRWNRQIFELITINADEFAVAPPNAQTHQQISLEAFVAKNRFSFPIVRGSEDLLSIYNILYRQLFDRHRDLSLPTSFLIDAAGNMVKVYQGPIDPERVEEDFHRIPQSDAERLRQGLPFLPASSTFDFGRNHLSLGSVFFQRGYLDQAEASFQQASREDPASAEALYGIGSVYLNQNKNDAARDAFQRCVKLQAAYPATLPDAWNNLGVLDTREGRIADSIQKFQQALKLNPNHLLSLVNLGNAYRAQKDWDAAKNLLQHAVEIAPDDAEANYALGMVFAQENDTASAYEHLQTALKARPDYPEALNNLGVLYLLTQRRDDAVATFERCIRTAPTFDQAYLNLARVYALEGTRDKARAVLLELLKKHPGHTEATKMLSQLQ